ncbi:hypothetical protein PM082_015178 [Marasmius tenuissimus]|nr:hypothetical protein PM082_015178 [Marasmius tenuissimus]
MNRGRWSLHYGVEGGTCKYNTNKDPSQERPQKTCSPVPASSRTIIRVSTTNIAKKIFSAPTQIILWTLSPYDLSTAVSSRSFTSSTSTSFTPKTVLTVYTHNQLYFTSHPSGAAVPLSDTRRVRSGTFSKQRGHKYTFRINPPKPIGKVKTAKGELEPRAGTLPRRTREMAQQQP